MPTPEEIAAAFQAKYGHVPSTPEEVAQADREASAAADALPGAVPDQVPVPAQGAPVPGQAPATYGQGWQAAAPQAPAGPASPQEVMQEVATQAVAEQPIGNATATHLQNMPRQGPAGTGGGIAYLPTRQTSISQAQMDPRAAAALDAYKRYTQTAAEAEAKQGLAEAERVQAQARVVGERAVEMQRQNEEMAAQDAKQQNKLDELQARIEQKRADWSAAASKEFKDSRSPFSRIAGALAAGLGAFGATIGHTENWAQKTLDAQFERRYDEWKRGIAAKREDMTLEQQIFNETSNLFKDRRAAKLMARGLWLEQNAAAMDQASYVNKDETTKQQAIKTSAAVNAEAYKTIADAYARYGVTTQIGQSVAPVATGGKPGSDNSQLAAYEDRAKAVKAGKEAFGPEPSYYAEAANLRKEVVNMIPMVTNAQTLSDMVDEFQPIDFTSDVTDRKTKFNARVGKITSDAIQAASGTGVPVEEKAQRLRDMVGSGKMTAEGMKAAINEYAQAVAEAVRVKANAVHPQLRDITKEILTNQLGKDQVDAIWSGQVPGRARTVKQGAAAGGREL